MPGIKSDRLLSLGDLISPLLKVYSGSAGFPTYGIQQSITVPLGPWLLVDGVTYKGIVFISPVDGAYIKELWVSAAVKMVGGTNTLAFDNYDKSAAAARNVLSTTNIDPTAVPATALQGDKLTLSATLANRFMDKGDVLNFTLVDGTMTTDGQGYAVTAIIIVPEVQ